ncbi:hypothetical protein BOTBODRAFT_170707 [Botryobasidium botryosum FD-172 SS1]|uniref:Uncharacterized protein n=1 Tax=Botryobasidium botryosum (strain FD-172 SS1) TaxID=930990 RepID=A0A067MVK1_BOTB1|nr:hypothetical protein BOTBODRAFT_170707 [Botryobasidium botryosum FD-172 SS1]
MSLDIFPTEIIQEIFLSACLDDGRTARVLCLVSKHCNNRAKPLLFRSITVCGVAQMRAFVGLLHQDPGMARTVRYLFLSENDVTPRDGIDDSGSSGMARYRDKDEIEDLERLSSNIFQCLAPSLEILSYATLPHSNGIARIHFLYSEP